jgi:hypothetical protein
MRDYQTLHFDTNKVKKDNIYFVKIAQIIYKHNTSLHQWGYKDVNFHTVNFHFHRDKLQYIL